MLSGIGMATSMDGCMSCQNAKVVAMNPTLNGARMAPYLGGWIPNHKPAGIFPEKFPGIFYTLSIISTLNLSMVFSLLMILQAFASHGRKV